MVETIDRAPTIGPDGLEPGVDYWRTFDPAKYDFYNPPRTAQAATTIDHGEADGSHRDPYDPGTPPPLSPIDELDDDLQSRAGRRTPSLFTSEISNAFDSGHASMDGRSSEKLSLEELAELLFSRQHLCAILDDQAPSIHFATFLRTYRPGSVPMLSYYHQATKALKAMRYTEAIIRDLQPVAGEPFTSEVNSATMPFILEDKINRALDILVKDDLPAFVAYCYVKMVDLALVDRVIGRQNPISHKIAYGLAEVFVLSDPARLDNPIVFSSEDFHRMTGFTRQEFLGKNCRALGGPKTSTAGRARFKASQEAEREHCEVLLNYRCNGSAFFNLIMCVPLRDQSGKVRYYLGAQLDITDLVVNCTEMSSLYKILQTAQSQDSNGPTNKEAKLGISGAQQLEELGQTLDPAEMDRLILQRTSHVVPTGHEVGLRGLRTIHKPSPALPLKETVPPPLGFYQNYLLVRPYPSLRILFASPNLRSSSALQSRLLDRIGGSSRVRDDLTHALELGRKVTAKVQWLTATMPKYKTRWIHCTPLLGVNDAVGVWMVILIDAEDDQKSLPGAVAPRSRHMGLDEPNPAADAVPWATESRTEVAKHSAASAATTTGMEADRYHDDEIIISRGKAGAISKEKKLMIPSDLLNNADRAQVQTLADVKADNGYVVGGKSVNSSTTQESAGKTLVAGPDHSRPAILIAGHRSMDRSSQAPNHMPGTAALKDDLDRSKPIRRTYKSLSPFGIIIDERDSLHPPRISR